VSRLRRTKDKVLPFPWVVAVVSDVGEALLFLARKRILHLDVSIKNVMVAPVEGKRKLPRAVLVDFGCARQLDTDDLRLPLARDAHDLNGNRGHLAPEVSAQLQRRGGHELVLDFKKQVLCGWVAGEGVPVSAGGVHGAKACASCLRVPTNPRPYPASLPAPPRI
jgi:serine/threonine protein kinase